MWEPFLTERDRAHHLALRQTRRRGFGRPPALRLIDPYALNLFDTHQKYADVLPVAEVLPHLQAAVE